jgi:hypothetical protein
MKHRKVRMFGLVAALAMLGVATFSLRAYAAVLVHSEMDLTGTTTTSDCPDNTDTFLFTSGSLLIEGTLTQTDNNIHLTAHVNSQNVSAIDLNTGASYRVVTNSDEVVNSSLDQTGSGAATLVTTALLVGQGGGPAENAHVLVHLTITPDGTMTAVIDKVQIDCQ